MIRTHFKTQNKTWFAIETSSPQLSMALGKGSELLREISRKGNASVLIEPLFRELDIDLNHIDLCMISQGPGSYNGLRVGYAFLKGLLCLKPLPVIQIPTSFILAKIAFEQLGLKKGTFLVLNNARCEEVYGALIDVQNGQPHLLWEWLGNEKVLLSKLSSHLDAIVSYDYKPSDFPDLAQYPWLSLFPTASFAGQIIQQSKLTASIQLSKLEPHYVRAAVRNM